MAIELNSLDLHAIAKRETARHRGRASGFSLYETNGLPIL